MITPEQGAIRYPEFDLNKERQSSATPATVVEGSGAAINATAIILIKFFFLIG
jgi:hypothetical protein